MASRQSERTPRPHRGILLATLVWLGTCLVVSWVVCLQLWLPPNTGKVSGSLYMHREGSDWSVNADPVVDSVPIRIEIQMRKYPSEPKGLPSVYLRIRDLNARPTHDTSGKGFPDEPARLRRQIEAFLASDAGVLWGGGGFAGPTQRFLFDWKGAALQGARDAWLALLCLTGAYGYVIWRITGRSRQRRIAKRLQDNCCVHCGYALSGLDTGRCPECGGVCH